MEGGDGYTETVWAEPVGGDIYRLDNIPYFAYGLSLGDHVRAAHDGEGPLRMVELVKPSGNRTLRVAFLDQPGASSDEAAPLREHLEALGCELEIAFSTLLAVSVPAAVALNTVEEFLTEQGVDWERADPPG